MDMMVKKPSSLMQLFGTNSLQMHTTKPGGIWAMASKVYMVIASYFDNCAQRSYHC